MYAAFLIVYLGALVVMGATKARKVKTQEDFSLAGRGLSGVVLTGTLLATWIGTGSIYGNAQKAYQDGLSAFILPLASAGGIVILFLLAARIRRMEKFTIQDILEERFGVVARLIGTVALLCGYLIIVSYQYRAGATVLEYVMPDLSDVGPVIRGEPRGPEFFFAAFVIAYTALAGMFSVAYTDVANGVLMLLGLAIALPLLLSEAGGVSEVMATLPEEKSSFFGYGPARVISYLLPAFLLILGDANMYQRFFSARDPRTARRSAAGMFFGVLLLDWLILAVAACGLTLVLQGKLSAPENPAHTVIHIAFHALPAFVGAMLAATVVAVVVSTADSYLLSPATSVVRDVYQRFLRPRAGDREMVLVGRLTVVLLGVAALGLAFTSDAFFEVAIFAYTLYGASITPALLAAFFWPRATSAGAVAGMLVGLGSAIAWDRWAGGAVSAWADGAGHAEVADFVRNLDAALPAVALSVLALVGVSLLGKAPARREVSA